jgi:hypothetical protein
MNLLSKSMLVMLCLIFTATSIAQKAIAKQKLFAANPENISLNKSIITDAFSYNTGTSVSIDLSSNFHFVGTVISNQQKYDNLQTIMIRSSENNHSIFQISKITNIDKSISYAGRIINDDAADGYAIKNNNGIYSLQKFETDKILEFCK